MQVHAAHVADVERKTAESLAVQQGVDWGKRQGQQHEDEWLTRSEIIALAREAIERWEKSRSALARW